MMTFPHNPTEPIITDISTPIPVETPAQITVMESAILALKYSGNTANISGRQASALLMHIDWLERQLKRRDETVSDLADRLSGYEVGAFEDGLDE